MSDRVKLAREIAARTKPRFVEEKPRRPQTFEGMRKLARAIAARSEPRFITIPRRGWRLELSNGAAESEVAATPVTGSFLGGEPVSKPAQLKSAPG